MCLERNVFFSHCKCCKLAIGAYREKTCTSLIFLVCLFHSRFLALQKNQHESLAIRSNHSSTPRGYMHAFVQQVGSITYDGKYVSPIYIYLRYLKVVPFNVCIFIFQLQFVEERHEYIQTTFNLNIRTPKRKYCI